MIFSLAKIDTESIVMLFLCVRIGVKTLSWSRIRTNKSADSCSALNKHNFFNDFYLSKDRYREHIYAIFFVRIGVKTLGWSRIRTNKSADSCSALNKHNFFNDFYLSKDRYREHIYAIFFVRIGVKTLGWSRIRTYKSADSCSALNKHNFHLEHILHIKSVCVKTEMSINLAMIFHFHLNSTSTQLTYSF